MWWRVAKTVLHILDLMLVTMGKVILGLLAGVFLLLAFLAHFVSGPRL